jgi:hypothetical protein
MISTARNIIMKPVALVDRKEVTNALKITMTLPQKVSGFNSIELVLSVRSYERPIKVASIPTSIKRMNSAASISFSSARNLESMTTIGRFHIWRIRGCSFQVSSSYFHISLLLAHCTRINRSQLVLVSYQFTNPTLHGVICAIHELVFRLEDFREIAESENIQKLRKYLLKQEGWRSGFLIKC